MKILYHIPSGDYISMSDNQDSQNDDIPTQESAIDTSNQDTKISYGLNGERYIGATEEE